MEETLSTIIHGCNLARYLESNLPHLSNQSSTLSNYCDEIIRVFKTAKDRLDKDNPLLPFDTKIALQEPSELRLNELDAAVHEWLRSSYAQNMELVHAQISEDNKKNPFTKTGSSRAKILEWNERKTENMLDNAEGSLDFPRSEVEGSAGSGKSPVAQRSRKRKDGVDKWTVRAAIPRMGNTDIPPDDGFTWRKYGQKEILGSMFPRGYYRCTHKTFYGCDAKKQVQRLDEDPNTFEVTYYGNHTCHISQTAPSPSPISTAASTSIIRQQEPGLENLSPPPPPPASTSLSLHSRLSMDMGGVHKNTDTFKELQLQMYGDFNQMGERGNITSIGTAGPSNLRDAKGGVEFPVVDLADAMFNSGGSSNSLDSIFPSPMQDS
ncbi:hypothetical protein AQUCO_03000182v1 [Aquilegia coerulea]|uniref:WRKY domain-containing protein n=1 Tax=Aquilegia coerulea TaxID=218851 RepID=A0A2G5D1P6_AQUCA|nr:hypothetical protein AQUCO_03000182v1 [Aquilegia coerulea]